MPHVGVKHLAAVNHLELLNAAPSLSTLVVMGGNHQNSLFKRLSNDSLLASTLMLLVSRDGS